MLASLREFFLLERARARASTRPATPPATVRLRAAAQRRRQASAALVGPDVALGALVIDREALLLEARARGDETSDEAALSALGTAIDAIEPARRESIRRAFDALTAKDPLTIDALEPAQLLVLREDVEDLLAWLDDEANAPTPARLKMTRAFRIGGVVIALALVLRLVGGVLLTPPNRALHKPVSASSRFPDTPESSGLTDGNRKALGVHTQVEPTGAWVRVDLGLTYKVRTIKVYNRTECCQDEGLPYIVEASVPNDPAPFIAKRETSFDVWEIPVGGHAATTIKISSGKTPGYVALSELEVVGDR